MVLAAPGAALMAAGSAADGSSPPLIEGPHCDQAPPAPPPPAPATLTAGGAAVPMVLVIPPTVFLRVDGDAVTHVTTNTGCAPRPTDRFLVEIGGGPVSTAAVPAQIGEVLAQRFAGDWRESGRWHAV